MAQLVNALPVAVEIGGSNPSSRTKTRRQNTPIFSTHFYFASSSNGRTTVFEAVYRSSNLWEATVVLAYLVNVLDCESKEQGSIPETTLTMFS